MVQQDRSPVPQCQRIWEEEEVEEVEEGGWEGGSEWQEELC